jgi:hypothetical protein
MAEKTAPCGCKMKREGNVFTIEPCSLTCGVYMYVVEQSKKRGNKIVELKKH